MELKTLKIKNLALAIGGAIVVLAFFKLGCNNAQKGAFGGSQKVNWQLVTTWSDNLPLLQNNVELMVKEIELVTDGRISITLVDPLSIKGGNRPFNLLKAVAEGESVQMLHSAPNYWEKEIPAMSYFGSVPFGLSHGEVKQWLNKGGLDLWRGLYDAYKINVVPFSCGHSGQQMGGWFKHEIKEASDLRNLRMRISGLGGDVLKHCFDVQPSTQMSSEIFKGMQDGTLDAAEWIGPFDDYRLGLHTLNAYYYEPGWHQPNAVFELTINKTAYAALSPDLQAKLTSVIEKYDSKIYQDYIDQNQVYRKTLENKLHVPFRRFPRDILTRLYNCTETTLAQYNEADKTGWSTKVYESYRQFKGKTEF